MSSPTPPPPSETAMTDRRICPTCCHIAPPSETKLKEAPTINELSETINLIVRFEAEVRKDCACGYPVDRPSLLLNAARSSLESLYRDLEQSRDDWKRAAQGWEYETEVRDRQVLELSALRSLQLTQKEATFTAVVIRERKYSYADAGILARIYEKLQRISSKATSEEL